MRFLHLSDLHFGKVVNSISMIDEQRHAVSQILDIIDRTNPNAVIIAGDIYDKYIPSVEAVELFSDFLARLSEKKHINGDKSETLHIFIISGNHDSPERLDFGSKIMDRQGVHIRSVFEGAPSPITLEDDIGKVNFYLLPFVKPVHVRSVFPDEEIVTYNDAVRTVLSHTPVNREERNVIVTHQFITSAKRCDSETVTSVGGTDNIDSCEFDAFDYVALGHIHGPQSIDRETVRYCGTPISYSFSEMDQQKSVTVVDMDEKGSVKITLEPLTPLHNMREIRGSYDELTLRANYEGTDVNDYIRVVLTDEAVVQNPLKILAQIYPNIMSVMYDNERTRASSVIAEIERLEEKSNIELLNEFFLLQNGAALNEEQISFSKALFEALGGDLK